MQQFLKTIIVMVVLSLASIARADMVLTTPPLFDEEKSKAIFEPFAEALSNILEQKVVYDYPKDWLVYAREMRSGNYDLIFDQAHFVSWRLQPQNIFHSPVVSLPGKSRYLVITRDNASYLKVEDLLGTKVCALPSPSLSTIVFLNQFHNPVRQPLLIEATGGFEGVFEKFKNRRCNAAVVSQAFYGMLKEKGQADDLKVLFTSQEIPKLTMTISKKFPREVSEKLVEALTDELSPKGAEQVFTQFARGENRFQQASEEDFDTLKGMLQGVVWGW